MNSLSLRRKVGYLVSGAAILLMLGFAAFAHAQREDSFQLIRQVTQELHSVKTQVSKMDTDSAGHKTKLEKLIDDAERESQEYTSALEKEKKR